MSQAKLNEVLQELKSQLEQLDVQDKSAKDRLQSLVDSLEKRLGGAGEEAHHSLVEEVRDSVEHFEVEHPRLTAILNDLMMTLSNMGI